MDESAPTTTSPATPAMPAIPPATYLTIARNAAGFSAMFGLPPQIAGLSLRLRNRGDRIILRDPTGAEIDRVAWEGYDPGWSITANRGDSIERSDLTVDTDTNADWMVTSPAAPRGL